ncbi:hypothetical protein [Actinocorallia aurantiaca]|uniref:Uncharacterized protein n=1 Tax=Actinocorallia aurantiaca TaxID=46204 RepID=A0ABN3UNP4_9ACTN
MSEILVERAHIDALLTAAVEWGEREPEYARFSFDRQSPDGSSGVPHSQVKLTGENASELGREIWLFHFEMCDWWDEEDEEIPDAAEVEGYAFDPLPGSPDPLVILRAIDFYQYQTAPEQLEDWSDTNTYQFLQYLRSMAIMHLPGIDRAPWGISDRDVFLAFAEPGS